MGHALAEDVDPGFVLAKATLRAAELMGITKSGLGSILGLGASTVTRLADGRRALDPESAEGRLAVVFVRVFRSLFAQFGDNAEPARQWLHTPHALFGRPPVELLATPQGLVHVLDYLDAMRGR